MSSLSSKLVKCEHCGKYKRRLYDVNDMRVCSDCIRGQAFYRVFKDGFREPSLRGDVITVGMDVGNIVWFNPFSQAWFYPLLLWMFFKTKGLTLHLSDLEASWRYKTPLSKVLQMYQEEEIFKVIESEDIKVIMEGEALTEMLKKYGDRPDVFDVVGAWVSGLIISRLHKESEAPDFRAVSSVINCIAEKLVDTDGTIKAEPYTKTTGYRCRICGGKFASKEDIRRHIMVRHTVPSDEIMVHVEEEGIIVGYLLDYDGLLRALEEGGVKPERFVERMQKFAILVHEDPEVPWIIERNGKKYIVIEPAWVRLVARTRVYERELVRGLERLR